jgi:hypothetical protein
MARNLAMRITKKIRSIQNGTAGSSNASSLINGTVLNVVGPGADLTSSPSIPLSFFVMPTAEHYRIVEEGIIKPVIRRPNKMSVRRGKRGPEQKAPRMMEALTVFQRRAPTTQLVLLEKIKHLGSTSTGVKLVGREGSAQAPVKKNFDVDLDRYQLD